MATYDGYLINHESAVMREQQLQVPWIGWDRDWDELWGHSIGVFGGWDIDWADNWGNPQRGTWRPVNTAIEMPQGLGVYAGARTGGSPISWEENTYAGTIAPGWGTGFYNRILIEPTFIDFGSILGTQSFEIEIFNAYLADSTLSDLVETNFRTGLTLTADATPTVYGALEERTYTLEAVLAGPPRIDATLTFDWLAPIVDIDVSIIGTRIVLLPVTYRARMRETLIWKTDVLNSYNGTEQRVKVRRYPRHRLSVKAYLDREERTRVENLIYGWRQRDWAIPIWHEARKADSPVLEDDTIIDVDTQYADFRVDGLAALWESPKKFDVFQIDSFTASSITLTRGVNSDFDDPWVMPVRTARMVKNPIRRTTGYDAVLDTILEVTDNYAYPADASAIQYLGEDTFFMEPLQTGRDGSPDTYEHRMVVIDNVSGLVNQYAPWDNIRIQRDFELILEGAQEIWEFKQWLYRRAGKLVPFYMPTYEYNLRVLNTGTVVDSLEVVENDYATQATSRNHIVIKQTDGTYLFREIIDAEINQISGNTDLTLDVSLNIDASTIDEVNFIGLKRLSSDQIDLEWLANSVVSVTVPIVELEP
jgi:hypothetical protein